MLRIFSDAVNTSTIRVESTSVMFSWITTAGAKVTGYNISYSASDGTCLMDDGDTISVDNTTMNYTLHDLQEFTGYEIIVEVLSEGFVVGDDYIILITEPVGKSMFDLADNKA